MPCSPRERRSGALLTCLAVAACSPGAAGGGPPFGTSASGSAGTTGASTPTSTSASTGGTGASGSATSGTDGAPSTGGASTGDSPKFDVAAGDAGPGWSGDGLPTTCAQAASIRTSVGCSFRAVRVQNLAEFDVNLQQNVEKDSAIVVGNISEAQDATIQLYYASGGGEDPQGAPVTLGPLQTHEFVLSKPAPPGQTSGVRAGTTFRVESDRPIVAYLHSPIAAEYTNDASLLIPDHAQGRYHIAPTWATNSADAPYFYVIGLESDTVVTWEPPVDTWAGGPVPAVPAGGSGQASLGTWDLLHVVAGEDISGTILSSTKPVWALGGARCVQIPDSGVENCCCDHIEEQLLPLESWGDEYVAAAAPARKGPKIWRVFSGADGVTISSSPAAPGLPTTLDRGDFVQITTTEHLLLSADGPFLPVQYLPGQNLGAGDGDPASVQMIPTAQFLPRYVFVTGKGYTRNYAQIIRAKDGPPVEIDGVKVTSFVPVGAYEVSDWPIAEGAHVASSDAPFGLIQVGYTNFTSYAYPGGLGLSLINPNPEG